MINIFELYDKIPKYHKMLSKLTGVFRGMRLTGSRRREGNKLLKQFQNIPREEQVPYVIYMLNKMNPEELWFVLKYSYSSLLIKYHFSPFSKPNPRDQYHTEQYYLCMNEIWEKIRVRMLRGEAVKASEYHL